MSKRISFQRQTIQMHRPRPKNTRKTKIKIQLSTIPEQNECIDIILTKNILNTISYLKKNP